MQRPRVGHGRGASGSSSALCGRRGRGLSSGLSGVMATAWQQCKVPALSTSDTVGIHGSGMPPGRGGSGGGVVTKCPQHARQFLCPAPSSGQSLRTDFEVARKSRPRASSEWCSRVGCRVRPNHTKLDRHRADFGRSYQSGQRLASLAARAGEASLWFGPSQRPLVVLCKGCALSGRHSGKFYAAVVHDCPGTKPPQILGAQVAMSIESGPNSGLSPVETHPAWANFGPTSTELQEQSPRQRGLATALEIIGQGEPVERVEVHDHRDIIHKPHIKILGIRVDTRVPTKVAVPGREAAAMVV